ncbi:MAG: twin-arginine translocase TatA/TatE family subunit [Deltaproteobacteria bacterium]|nr:twin-arginine translocase TatA/TatE family subunit [Deltaproteobacteria bacterium]
MLGVSSSEFFIILAVALMILGPKKLPELARALGRAIGEFKKASSEMKRTLQEDERLSEIKKTFDDAVTEGMTSGGIFQEMVRKAAEQGVLPHASAEDKDKDKDEEPDSSSPTEAEMETEPEALASNQTEPADQPPTEPKTEAAEDQTAPAHGWAAPAEKAEPAAPADAGLDQKPESPATPIEAHGRDEDKSGRA